MPRHTQASQSQRQALNGLGSRTPLLLQIHWVWASGSQPEPDWAQCLIQLKELGGRALTHARCDSQVIGCGSAPWQTASVWALPSRDALQTLIDSPAFTALSAHADHVRAIVATQAPRIMQHALRLASIAMRLLPAPAASSPIPSDAISGGVNPTPQQFEAFKASPQHSRIHMFNLLKFEGTVQAPATGKTPEKTTSGKRLYGERYAPVATDCIFRLGGKIVAMGRYALTLIGQNGDPAPRLWHELVVVQYPNRAAFLRMLSNARYQAAVVHREAALERTELWATSPSSLNESPFFHHP